MHYSYTLLILSGFVLHTCGATKSKWKPICPFSRCHVMFWYGIKWKVKSEAWNEGDCAQGHFDLLFHLLLVMDKAQWEEWKEKVYFLRFFDVESESVTAV